jgi:hypothetical protein
MPKRYISGRESLLPSFRDGAHGTPRNDSKEEA